MRTGRERILQYLLSATLVASTASSDPLTVTRFPGLIERFRPFIKTSIEPDRGREPCHPCTWQWFVSHCNLIKSNIIVIPSAALSRDPSLLVTAPGGDIRTSPASNPDLTLRLVDDSYRQGESWSAVASLGHGIYAHAEPIGVTQLNIEYIVLWPYNKTTVTGDHEGDVTAVSVVYDSHCDRIIRATYVLHGGALETYVLTHPKKIQTVTLDGEDLNQHKITTAALEIETSGADSYRHGPFWHGPCDRSVVYFAQDPQSKAFEHIVVYSEWGTHELWPAPCGSVTTAPKHNGLGPSFLPDSVRFLGSGSHFAPSEEPFVFYNGKLGNDPQGIMLHRQWYFPEGRSNNQYHIPEDRFSDVKDEDPYVSHSNVPWPPARDCPLEPPSDGIGYEATVSGTTSQWTPVSVDLPVGARVILTDCTGNVTFHDGEKSRPCDNNPVEPHRCEGGLVLQHPGLETDQSGAYRVCDTSYPAHSRFYYQLINDPTYHGEFVVNQPGPLSVMVHDRGKWSDNRGVYVLRFRIVLP